MSSRLGSSNTLPWNIADVRAAYLQSRLGLHDRPETYPDLAARVLAGGAEDPGLAFLAGLSAHDEHWRIVDALTEIAERHDWVRENVEADLLSLADLWIRQADSGKLDVLDMAKWIADDLSRRIDISDFPRFLPLIGAYWSWEEGWKSEPIVREELADIARDLGRRSEPAFEVGEG